MALVAVTDINHGTTEGTYYVEAGSEVDESKFTEDELKSLKAAGAVEESKALEHVQGLREKVAELEAQIAALQTEQAVTGEGATARRLDQTALDPLAGVPAGEDPSAFVSDAAAAQKKGAGSGATTSGSTPAKSTSK